MKRSLGSTAGEDRVNVSSLIKEEFYFQVLSGRAQGPSPCSWRRDLTVIPKLRLYTALRRLVLQARSGNSFDPLRQGRPVHCDCSWSSTSSKVLQERGTRGGCSPVPVHLNKFEATEDQVADGTQRQSPLKRPKSEMP